MSKMESTSRMTRMAITDPTAIHIALWPTPWELINKESTVILEARMVQFLQRAASDAGLHNKSARAICTLLVDWISIIQPFPSQYSSTSMELIS